VTDLPILAPTECAALAAIEANMTPGPWRHDRSNRYVCSDSAPGFGIVMQPRENDVVPVIELRNSFACLLATIAALRSDAEMLGATIAELKRQLGERK
jgi:hypothetical protein